MNVNSMKNEEKANSKVGIRTMLKKTLKLWGWSILHFRFSWYYPGVPEMKPEEVYEKLQSENPPYLIDVRDGEDIAKAGKIEGAVMYPYFDFIKDIEKVPKNANSYVTHHFIGKFFS